MLLIESKIIRKYFLTFSAFFIIRNQQNLLRIAKMQKGRRQL